MRDDDDLREGHHVDGSTARARHRLRQELRTNVGTVVCGWTLERIRRRAPTSNKQIELAAEPPLPFRLAELITLK